MQKKLHLQGKTVFITGASRGLGRAIAQECGRQGASIGFTFSKDEQGAAVTEELLKDIGTEPHRYRVSVLDWAEMRNAAKDFVSAHGRIDALVNNAGISQALPLALMEEADWDSVMDINMKGMFIATHSVLPHMIKGKKGVILNMGSLAGDRIIEAPIHYSASKAAVRGFTEALAKEFSRNRIRANCLAPGLLDEGMGSQVPDYKREDYVKNISLGRLGSLAEVARFAAFLVSDRSSYINGETIRIDGGF